MKYSYGYIPLSWYETMHYYKSLESDNGYQNQKIKKCSNFLMMSKRGRNIIWFWYTIRRMQTQTNDINMHLPLTCVCLMLSEELWTSSLGILRQVKMKRILINFRRTDCSLNHSCTLCEHMFKNQIDPILFRSWKTLKVKVILILVS